MIKKILTRAFNVLLYLLPVFLIAGIIDFRFHNYFWPDISWPRFIQPMAMFDFFSVLDFYILGLFVIWFLMMIFVKELRPDFKFRWIYFIIVFVIAGLVVARVSYIANPFSVKSFNFQALINYVNPILLFLMMIFSIKKKEVLKNLSTAFLLSFSLFGLVILTQNFTSFLPGGAHDFLGRLSWPYIDPFFGLKAENANWLAFLFGPILILATIELIKIIRGHVEKWHRYIVPAASSLISILILFFTKSYTGFLIAFVVFGYLLFINLPKTKRKYFFVGLLVVLILALGSQIDTRKFQILIGNDKQETSINRRLQIYEFNYKAFLDRPLTGIGPGNYQGFFKDNMEKYLEEKIPDIEIPPHPHNLIIYFWSDLGIFGLLSILIIYIFGVVKVFTKNKNLYVFVLIYLLGHGLLDLPYGSDENSVLFWTVLAMIVIQETFIKAEAR